MWACKGNLTSLQALHLLKLGLMGQEVAVGGQHCTRLLPLCIAAGAPEAAAAAAGCYSIRYKVPAAGQLGKPPASHWRS